MIANARAPNAVDMMKKIAAVINDVKIKRKSWEILV
jgi:hypothetical protein